MFCQVEVGRFGVSFGSSTSSGPLLHGRIVPELRINREGRRWTFFLLWHVYDLADDDGAREEEKLIGVFSSEAKAHDAIEQLKVKEGFREHPINCFEIHRSRVDRLGWTDGFTTLRQSD
ncbi:DUF7336 domain-containing protein [Bifidobacterium samirii]|uniref:DUF7336 domain-containing protein n=1 Tax=Bifidobacterium samirii TaxID=2306974 RepID=UPI003B97780F